MHRGKLPAIDETPDSARAFGRKIRWMAVHANAPEAVIEVLRESDGRYGEAEVSSCNWHSGIGRIEANPYGVEVFVSPPVNGWVLLVNWFATYENELESYESTLGRMSEVFGEAVAFQTHRGVGLKHWALATDGELIRCVAEADATTTIEVGKRTDLEERLGVLTEREIGELSDNEQAGDSVGDLSQRIATEQTVISLAEGWSINPLTLGDEDETGVGFLVQPGGA